MSIFYPITIQWSNNTSPDMCLNMCIFYPMTLLWPSHTSPDTCLNKCIFYQINLVAKAYQPRHVPEQVHLHQSTIAASGISQLPTFVRHTQHKPFQFESTPLLWAVLRSSLLFDTDLSPKSINQCIFI